MLLCYQNICQWAWLICFPFLLYLRYCQCVFYAIHVKWPNHTWVLFEICKLLYLLHILETAPLRLMLMMNRQSCQWQQELTHHKSQGLPASPASHMGLIVNWVGVRRSTSSHMNSRWSMKENLSAPLHYYSKYSKLAVKLLVVWMHQQSAIVLFVLCYLLILFAQLVTNTDFVLHMNLGKEFM